MRPIWTRKTSAHIISEQTVIWKDSSNFRNTSESNRMDIVCRSNASCTTSLQFARDMRFILDLNVAKTILIFFHPSASDSLDDSVTVTREFLWNHRRCLQQITNGSVTRDVISLYLPSTWTTDHLGMILRDIFDMRCEKRMDLVTERTSRFVTRPMMTNEASFFFGRGESLNTQESVHRHLKVAHGRTVRVFLIHWQSVLGNKRIFSVWGKSFFVLIHLAHSDDAYLGRLVWRGWSLYRGRWNRTSRWQIQDTSSGRWLLFIVCNRFGPIKLYLDCSIAKWQWSTMADHQFMMIVHEGSFAWDDCKMNLWCPLILSVNFNMLSHVLTCIRALEIGLFVFSYRISSCVLECVQHGLDEKRKSSPI